MQSATYSTAPSGSRTTILIPLPSAHRHSERTCSVKDTQNPSGDISAGAIGKFAFGDLHQLCAGDLLASIHAIT